MSSDGATRFFALARARHQIYLRRAAGRLREQWTDDPILQKYRFTNIFRELDRTTVWFREHVRDPLRDRPEVLLATVVFRMFNRISTGEAVFCQPALDGSTAFDDFLETGRAARMRHDIRALCGDGPVCTGAYIITSPKGYSKLDGVLEVLKGVYQNSEWQQAAKGMLSHSPWALQQAHYWLSKQPWLGTFHSYEIVTDLRHTALLERAPDVDTWCSIGPGCRRGLNRVMGRGKNDRSRSVDQMLAEMARLLQHARSEEFWPQGDERNWPRWELRECEHTLCEFDKYERVRLGEGRPRGVYK